MCRGVWIIVFLAGCSPDLGDDCASPADCPADRPVCVAQVCVAERPDGTTPDGATPPDAALDAARPDAAPPLPDGSRPDGAPPPLDGAPPPPLDGAPPPFDGAPPQPDVPVTPADAEPPPPPDAAPADAACVPAPEACNGADDDCDDRADEAVAARDCYDGRDGTAGVGPCRGGTQACEFGGFGACLGQVVPGNEICDRTDNDCDGALDEDAVDCACEAGDTRDCYTGPDGTRDHGVCSAGSQSCLGGTFGPCADQVVPSAEQCDGRDTDCDDQVDEAVPGAGAVCSAGVGACQRNGRVQCVPETGLACDAVAGPPMPSEACNGADDDCDGRADEGIVPEPCQVDLPGRCADGISACNQGQLRCVPQVEPDAVEQCNGLDEDCDGDVDESPADALCGAPNVDGRCEEGECVRVCSPGFVDTNRNIEDGCERGCPPWPEAEDVGGEIAGLSAEVPGVAVAGDQWAVTWIEPRVGGAAVGEQVVKLRVGNVADARDLGTALHGYDSPVVARLGSGWALAARYTELVGLTGGVAVFYVSDMGEVVERRTAASALVQFGRPAIGVLDAQDAPAALVAYTAYAGGDDNDHRVLGLTFGPSLAGYTSSQLGLHGEQLEARPAILPLADAYGLVLAAPAADAGGAVLRFFRVDRAGDVLIGDARRDLPTRPGTLVTAAMRSDGRALVALNSSNLAAVLVYTLDLRNIVAPFFGPDTTTLDLLQFSDHSPSLVVGEGFLLGYTEGDPDDDGTRSRVVTFDVMGRVLTEPVEVVDPGGATTHRLQLGGSGEALRGAWTTTQDAAGGPQPLSTAPLGCR